MPPATADRRIAGGKWLSRKAIPCSDQARMQEDHDNGNNGNTDVDGAGNAIIPANALVSIHVQGRMKSKGSDTGAGESIIDGCTTVAYDSA